MPGRRGIFAAMKAALPTLVFYSVLAGALVLGACKKDGPDASAPTSAAIAGRVQPVGSVRTVTANGNGMTYNVTPNDSSGAFMFNNISAGTYAVSFTPAPGFAAPASRSVEVTAGNLANLGTVSGSTSNGPGLTFVLNGGAPLQALTASGVQQSTTLTITAVTTDGTLVMSLADFHGPDTYDLGSTTTTYASFINTAHRVWSTTAGGAGSLHLTAYDASALTLSGYFSFTANAATGGTGTPITVTNGSFTDVAFQ